ncbi:MAG: 2,4-dienoyl-CoA reductase-like NADH-dependent reductase (Old Yellow Enzyme family) [Halieaceae bacterium]|jgi:2,4-dienoyl-CoA reductase-like NADH-dependent reductase (Old Yellow Enzyme family)
MTSLLMTDSDYPTLFSPTLIGGVELRNRIVHAAILTGYVQDGRPTDKLLNYYRSRARGGAAMIVTEPLAMTGHNRSSSRLRVWDDSELDSLKRCAEVVEGEGARLLGQVQDSGRGRHEVGRNEGAVGASALPDDLSWTVPKVLDAGEIRQMIDDWAQSSYRLQRAGFSGVEISAGHGHLFHQFLSPASNHREDAYGGDLEGRTRFLRELIAAIRSACSGNFIIGLKLPGADGVAGGIDLEAARTISERLAADAENFDYWTWAWGAHANSLYQHLPDAHGERHPYLDSIRDLRQVAPSIPSGALGYITDPNECETALTDGTADLVFLGRPLITDPAFPNKARVGDEKKIRYCVSCNTCWRSIIEGSGLACDNNPRVGAPDEVDWRPAAAPRRKHLAVVGAGIAGLEAAHTAAARGHRVTVFGASDDPGGKTRLHAELAGGENLSSIYDYQYLAGREHGVTYRLGERATMDTLLALAPDVVLLATGATAVPPAFIPREYIDLGFVLDARQMAMDMLGRSGREPGRVVLFDQDHTEMTYALAELLSERFDDVSIVTPRDRIASDVSLVTRQGIYQRLSDRGVAIHTCVQPQNLDALEDAVLDVVNVYNGAVSRLEDVVAVCYSTSRAPDDALAEPLREAGITVFKVGDCRAPRTVLAATREGYEVAFSL